MKKTIFALALLLPAVLFAQQHRLSSPDGKYAFVVEQKSGELKYSICYDGTPVVLESQLGVEIDNRLFENALAIPNDSCEHWIEDLKLIKAETSLHDETWTPPYGENATIRDRYNALTLHFYKGSQASDIKDFYDKAKLYFFDIEVRAYDEGVAFRYHFPETSNGLFLNITGERTSFRMPDGTMAYYEEWAQGPFHVKPLKDWERESERPLLMKLPDGKSVALLEAAMTDYARGKFRLAADNTLQVSMYGGVEVMSPYSTPWRVVMVGEKDVELINNKDLILNLNEPCKIADTSFIRPGKAFRCALERGAIMKGIKFARERGLQYIELDSRWYGPEQKMASSALTVAPEMNFDIKEICDSAREAGLGVFLYVNQRALYKELDDILARFKAWGVSGIKFGFVQIGNQMWSTWLHDAVRKCAEQGILVDIHDEYRPTGFSRTYPNLLTQEGIRGNEEMPDATHNVTLPFTRYLCGPADYTLCYYSNRIKTTRAHQLAMAAVYYSPLQFMFWYDSPGVKDSGEELKFWHDIPTVFDESRALDGQAGEYIIQARRCGERWFVGAMTNKEARDITIRTAAFLPAGMYQAELFVDDPSLPTASKVACKTMKIKSGKDITLSLRPSGGAALIFTPVK